MTYLNEVRVFLKYYSSFQSPREVYETCQSTIFAIFLISSLAKTTETIFSVINRKNYFSMRFFHFRTILNVCTLHNFSINKSCKLYQGNVDKKKIKKDVSLRYRNTNTSSYIQNVFLHNFVTSTAYVFPIFAT